MITTLTHPIRALRCALSVLLLGLAIRASAAPVSFDIPAQAAAEALDLFIKQSGANVVYLQADVQGVSTNAVQGTYEPAAALKLLLQNTVLTFTESKPGEFAVGRTKPGSIEGSVQSESGRPVAGARVTLAGSNQTVLTDKRGRFTFDEVPAGSQALVITAEGIQNTKVIDVNVKVGQRLTLSTIAVPVAGTGTVLLEDYIVSARKNEGIVELDPYEVRDIKPTAFSTANIDLTRTKDDVLPFQTFSAAELRQSGALNIQEFLQDRMTQNYSTFLPEESPGNGRMGFGSAGVSGGFNLASGGGVDGLQSDEMIILLNGRRIPNQYIDSSSKSLTPLIRGIPMGSVERIELLTSAASTIYGAGATGAVINIITKRNYSGGSLSLFFESPADTHAPRRTIQASYTLALSNMVTVRAGYSFSDATPLIAADRADVTTERWQKSVLARAPEFLDETYTLPLGATPNIMFFDSSFAIVGHASVPDGYTGGGNISQLFPRSYNMAMADGTSNNNGYGKKSWLGPKYRDIAAWAGFDWQITPRWQLSTEYQYTKNYRQGYDSNEQSRVFLASTNPANPFGMDLSVRWYDPRLDRPDLRHEATSSQDQIVTSLRGTIGEWQALIDASYIRNKHNFEDAEFAFLLGSNGNLIPWEEAVTTGLYNPFLDMRVAAPTALDRYEEHYHQVATSNSSQRTYQVSAKASGPVARLWAGAVNITSGIEWLREDAYSQNPRWVESRNSRTGALLFRGGEIYRPKFRSTSDTFSAYAEATVPLIDQRMDVPFAAKTEAFAAARYSVLDRVGARGRGSVLEPLNPGSALVLLWDAVEYTTKPYLYSFGVRHDVTPMVGMRGSMSIGFKPPTFGQTNSALPPTTNLTVTDRRTNQSVVLTPSMRLSGGNVDIKPETTESRNLGVIIRTTWPAELRVSVDFVESRRSDAIMSLSPQTVLDLEASDPRIASRVQRDSSGRIALVDARTINFREIVSKTADLGVDGHIRNVLGGRLLFAAAATKNISFKLQSSANAPAEEQVRMPDTAYGGLFTEWAANGSIRWEGDRWSFGWTTRYYDDVLVRTANRKAQGSDRAEWAMDHDFAIGYRASKSEGSWGSWLADTSITVGVKNMFDRKPRFSGGDVELGIIRADSLFGRSIWVHATKEF